MLDHAIYTFDLVIGDIPWAKLLRSMNNLYIVVHNFAPGVVLSSPLHICTILDGLVATFLLRFSGAV